VHYTVEQSTLRSGDAFVAYTDGVTEVRRPPRLISAEEIGGLVARAGSRSAQCLLQRLDQGLLALGRRDDDVAAIVVTIGSNSDGC
jgi:serine phosphatase RsbU (regulator of sigma subunit)